MVHKEKQGNCQRVLDTNGCLAVLDISYFLLYTIFIYRKSLFEVFIMKNMAHASAPKPAFRSRFSYTKASPAPFTGRTGQTSGLSFADVRIHYRGNVVQCHNFFTDQAGGSADQMIDAIFRALHIDAQKAANLKNNHMNFNQLNGVSPACT